MTIRVLASTAICFAIATTASYAEGHDIWNGSYVGLSVDSETASITGIQDCCAIDPGDDPDNLNPDGVALGMHIGHNIQRGRMVYGLEGHLFTGNIVDEQFSQSESTPNQSTIEIDRIASLQGRIGLALGRTLVYASAGKSHVRSTYTMRDPDGAVSVGNADLSGYGNVVGAGVEWMMEENVSLRLGYQHHVFDTQVDTSDLTTDSDAGDFVALEDVGIFNVGVSFHF